MCSFYLRFISSMHLLELCQPTCSCCEWLVVLAVSDCREPRLGFLGSRHWALYWDWGCPNFACVHLSSIFRSTAAALSPACPLCTCSEGHFGLQTHTKKWPNLNQGLSSCEEVDLYFCDLSLVWLPPALFWKQLSVIWIVEPKRALSLASFSVHQSEILFWLPQIVCAGIIDPWQFIFLCLEEGWLDCLQED